jgi:hypothetical protein
LIIGPKGLAEGNVEIKNRATGERSTAPLADVLAGLTAKAAAEARAPIAPVRPVGTGAVDPLPARRRKDSAASP